MGAGKAQPAIEPRQIVVRDVIPRDGMHGLASAAPLSLGLVLGAAVGDADVPFLERRWKEPHSKPIANGHLAAV